MRWKLLDDAVCSYQLFNIFKFRSEEAGEVFAAQWGYHDDIFVADVEVFFGHAQLGIDREHVTDFQWAARIRPIVVNGQAYRVRQDASASFDENEAAFS